MDKFFRIRKNDPPHVKVIKTYGLRFLWWSFYLDLAVAVSNVLLRTGSTWDTPLFTLVLKPEAINTYTQISLTFLTFFIFGCLVVVGVIRRLK